LKVLAVIHHAESGAGVFPEVVAQRGHQLELWSPSEEPLPRVLAEFGALITFGGGMQADQDEAHPWLGIELDALRAAVNAGIPTLGVCLGGQLLARALGGSVGPAPRPERGWMEIELTQDGQADALFAGLPRALEVYQWHSYQFGLPPQAVLLARSPTSPQCFRVGNCAWGLQWHPEVTGDSILQWAQEYRPPPDGVPESIDVAALRSAVAERIDQTNADGRELCDRFLAAAETHSA
jgi:GMP synthase-like glutamine amidotransferase